MALSSHQIEAFSAVAKAKSFSQASKKLNITQSALSQRILNLESELHVTLFVRESSGVRLTAVGESLFRYAQAKDAFEEEFLSGIKTKIPGELSGVLKIAGFSTLMRSKLMPALGSFARANPKVQVEVLVRELHEMPNLLKAGGSDFVFGTQAIEKQEFVNHFIGLEENVLVESKLPNRRENTYLDHDEQDTTTSDFLKIQRKAPPIYKRAYFDEIYVLIDAVEQGFGRAVVPLHLVRDNKRVSIVADRISLKVPVFLTYFKQDFYTKLQKTAIALLADKANYGLLQK